LRVCVWVSGCRSDEVVESAEGVGSTHSSFADPRICREIVFVYPTCTNFVTVLEQVLGRLRSSTAAPLTDPVRNAGSRTVSPQAKNDRDGRLRRGGHALAGGRPRIAALSP
jgi:hypothetical protein